MGTERFKMWYFQTVRTGICYSLYYQTDLELHQCVPITGTAPMFSKSAHNTAVKRQTKVIQSDLM